MKSSVEAERDTLLVLVAALSDESPVEYDDFLRYLTGTDTGNIKGFRGLVARYARRGKEILDQEETT